METSIRKEKLGKITEEKVLRKKRSVKLRNIVKSEKENQVKYQVPVHDRVRSEIKNEVTTRSKGRESSGKKIADTIRGMTKDSNSQKPQKKCNNVIKVGNIDLRTSTTTFLNESTLSKHSS